MSAQDRAAKRFTQTIKRPTPAQLKYLDGLLINGGFGTREQRNGYLSRMTNREIRYPDDLTLLECSKIISDLTDTANMKRELRDTRSELAGQDVNGWYGDEDTYNE
jgi:hypothetical protein